MESELAPWTGSLILVVSNRPVTPPSIVVPGFFATLGEPITAPGSFSMDVPWQWIAAILLGTETGAVSAYLKGAQFSRNIQP